MNRFENDFKNLIEKSRRLIEDNEKIKSKIKNISSSFNVAEDCLHIGLENEKGKKTIALYCFYQLEGHKDHVLYFEELKKNPDLKLENMPSKKIIQITEGSWHKPMYYDKKLENLRPSDFWPNDKKILEKSFFLEEKNKAIEFFLVHLSKILAEEW